VHAFEIDTDLAMRAGRTLTAWPQVQVHERFGAVGTLPKADAIYVARAIPFLGGLYQLPSTTG
jgi:hypothetical protein